MSAADAAVCECGHWEVRHTLNGKPPGCWDCPTCTAFVADVNRPKCPACGHSDEFHSSPRDGSVVCGLCIACCKEPPAASDRADDKDALSSGEHVDAQHALGAGELADLLAAHTIECTGPGEVTCRGCRDDGWMSWTKYRAHVAAVLIAAGWEKR